MNRADLSLVLNQVDNVGNTLLQNRMLKQRKEERAEDMGMRERMFTEQQATRKATEQATADWRKETARDRRIQAAIHNNASGTMDDASRNEFNQWIDSDPELRFSGLNLKAPPPKDAKGTMETSQTRNHAELKKLQEQIRSATTPEAKAQAEQDLADFKGLLPGRETPQAAKPVPTLDDEALKAARSKRADAVAAGNNAEVSRIDVLMDKLSGKLFKPAIGDLRMAESGRSDTGSQSIPAAPPNATQPQDPDDSQAGAVNVDVALQEAEEAIRAGAPRAKVIERLKKLGINIQ